MACHPAWPCIRLSPSPLHVVTRVQFDPLLTLLFSISSLHILLCSLYLPEFCLENLYLSDSQVLHTPYLFAASTLKAHPHATVCHPLIKAFALWVICLNFYWERQGRCRYLHSDTLNRHTPQFHQLQGSSDLESDFAADLPFSLPCLGSPKPIGLSQKSYKSSYPAKSVRRRSCCSLTWT